MVTQNTFVILCHCRQDTDRMTIMIACHCNRSSLYLVYTVPIYLGEEILSVLHNLFPNPRSFPLTNYGTLSSSSYAFCALWCEFGKLPGFCPIFILLVPMVVELIRLYKPWNWELPLLTLFHHGKVCLKSPWTVV